MDVRNITLEKLVKMKHEAAHLGDRATWQMSHEVFLHIRRLKDSEQNYVYPPCWEGDHVPPLLGLPVDVSLAQEGIAIVMANDPVEHPKHYTSHPSGIECITITEHMCFNLGNAVKYIWRADLKHDDAFEDLRKAKWYIEREIAKRSGNGSV